ncbi:MAG: hypothetical protein KTV77_00450 [Wolbachia endosymbiont of Fragariocoptes setiger]|nr:hypothetical protein [Wolbachia endosymbiont of Fragariocoptes setiger]
MTGNVNSNVNDNIIQQQQQSNIENFFTEEMYERFEQVYKNKIEKLCDEKFEELRNQSLEIKSYTRKALLSTAVVSILSQALATAVAVTISINWAMIAPVLATAGPMIGIIAASTAAAAVSTFILYRNRVAIKNGVTWATEKTVDGCKKSVEGIKQHLSRMSLNIAHNLQNLSGKTNYSEKVDQLTKEQKDNFAKVVEETKSLGVNQLPVLKTMLENIRSSLKDIIEKTDDTDKKKYLEKAQRFLNHLDERKLQTILEGKSVDKDHYLTVLSLSECMNEDKEFIHNAKMEDIKGKLSKSFGSIRRSRSNSKEGSIFFAAYDNPNHHNSFDSGRESENNSIANDQSIINSNVSETSASLVTTPKALGA